MPESKRKIIVAYVPVLHEGYRRFFEKHADAEALFILDEEITKAFKPLTKDIRALSPSLIKQSILAWNLIDRVEILKQKDWDSLSSSDCLIVMPDEEVMRELKSRNLPQKEVVFDGIFLRWDKHKSFEQKPVNNDQVVSSEDQDIDIIDLLRKEAEKSSDVWRQIGAAIVKDHKLIMKTHNHAVPSEHLPYVEGDPRSDFSKGVSIDLSTSFHGEAQLIAEAARKGICLENTSLYVTTFPCPPCAKLVAYSGIKKIYYADGYGVLDGERILKSQGVEIIFVKVR